MTEVEEAVARALLTAESDRLRICRGPAPCYPDQGCSCTNNLSESGRHFIAALEAAGYEIRPRNDEKPGPASP